MQGKIIVYSEQTGIGKIITPDSRKYNFNVDGWDDYETTPAVGEIVDFTAEGINAVNITVEKGAEADTGLSPASEKEREGKRENSGQNSPQSEVGDKEPAWLIEADMDVEACIELHFSDIRKRVSDCEDLLRENRRLDYIRMQRFLTTAYNNLIEIDHSFENYELAETRQELLDAHDAYRSFKSRTDYIQNAYEKVFLNKQSRYKELRAKLELNKSRIAKHSESAANLEKEIKEKSERLKRVPAQSEEYIYLFNEIKILKRSLVDTIHEVAKLTEENRLYIDLLDNFYKMYYDRFKKSFSEFAETYDSLMRKIQDVLAYRFDSLMWKKANRSKPIQSFFAKAGIHDEFSAVTYMKYYLKTLDSSKLNRQNQELMELMQYLEAQTKKRIVCIDDDTEFLGMVKSSLGEIDRDIKVVLSTRPEAVLPDLKNIQPNILIINPMMRGVESESIIEYARKIVSDIEIAFFAKRISRELLLSAKQCNVAAIIPKTLHKKELGEQLREYIE
ncbi:hypothetical protein NNO_0193 [Hydrogenimonas sp.]|nr:hypothetical protein NNO_0193 [Hydrogenimonas sp.]